MVWPCVQEEEMCMDLGEQLAVSATPIKFMQSPLL